MDRTEQTPAYEAPTITEIASLHELTLDVNKTDAIVSDGVTYHHHPINIS